MEEQAQLRMSTMPLVIENKASRLFSKLVFAIVFFLKINSLRGCRFCSLGAFLLLKVVDIELATEPSFFKAQCATRREREGKFSLELA